MLEFAKTPPKGWNSWDVYGASVTEEEVKRNADIMAEKLKKYGWNYVVVDIQWYEPGAESAAYRKFADLKIEQDLSMITSKFSRCSWVCTTC